MSLLFINVVGHNASGKSTLSKRLAEDLGLNRINGDDLRNMLRRSVPYFKDMPLYMPTEKSELMNPLVIAYRFQLAEILLDAGQNVILDGSGARREDRKVLFEKTSNLFPAVTNVLIHSDLPEETLLERLKERDAAEDGQWEAKYKEFKVNFFEPPAPQECEEFMVYTQDNYEEIEKRLRELLIR